MSYTKGPWKVEENRAYHTSWIIRGNDGNKLAQVANFQDVSFEINGESNARLIAAAPDLLEALQNAVELLETTGFDIEWHKSVIAQATGTVEK